MSTNPSPYSTNVGLTGVPVTVAQGGTGKNTAAGALTGLQLGYEPWSGSFITQLGIQAQNYPSFFTGNSAALGTAGVGYLVQIQLTNGTVTATNLVVNVVTAGGTLTADECFAALYDNNGVLIGFTLDQSTNWASTGKTTMALNAATGLTTVAAGSNGGAALNTIAAWAQPSAGVLDVASTTGFPSSGSLYVKTSTTNGLIAYTSVTGGGTPSFNGCTFTSGGTGTVATGNAVQSASANGGPFTVSAPWVYAFFVFNGTTGPAFARGYQGTGAPGYITLSQTASNGICASNGSSLLTVPASLTYSSNSSTTSNPQYFWVAIT